MRLLPFIFILCFLFTSGCAQTMKQHSNMLDAINGKLTPINYNKTYIFNTFGDPDSKSVSKSEGVTTEVWTYKTNMGAWPLLFNRHPQKTRYMKITIANTIVTDVTFE